jgi:hypothetical protein
MPRFVPLLLLMSIAASVAASPVVLRPGDPALDGKDHLLSDPDFHAIVAVVRAFLQRKAPWYTARRVHVISPSKVEVYLNPIDEYGYENGPLDVERTKDGWKVIGGIPERVIVTDLTNRWSQPPAVVLRKLRVER